MKIAVLNFSGNVGKTTIAAHLLLPRLPGARLFSIESLNVDASADGIDVEKMRGKKYGDLIEAMMQIDHAVVDVGASNVEDFLKLMRQYHASHEEFDLFLVPVVKEKKQQADTVATIRALSGAGIPRSKIIVVFNKVDPDETLVDEFAALFGLAKLENSFTLSHAATVHTNEVFDRLKSTGKSLQQILDDPTDYRARLRTATADDEKLEASRMLAIKRLGHTAAQNMDNVFQSLIPGHHAE